MRSSSTGDGWRARADIDCARAVEVADQAGEVDRDAAVGERLHLLTERLHRGLAEDLEGHALAHVRFAAAVERQRLGGVRQHVDEAGRDREAARFDHGLADGERTDLGDGVAVDGDVADERRRARCRRRRCRRE